MVHQKSDPCCRVDSDSIGCDPTITTIRLGMHHERNRKDFDTPTVV